MKNIASSAKWEISSIALQINVEIANSLHLTKQQKHNILFTI